MGLSASPRSGGSKRPHQAVLQPPWPLQSFLPLQPLADALQPPWPLQSFLPLQSCFEGAEAVEPADDAESAVEGELAGGVEPPQALSPRRMPPAAAAIIVLFIVSFLLSV